MPLFQRQNAALSTKESYFLFEQKERKNHVHFPTRYIQLCGIIFASLETSLSTKARRIKITYVSLTNSRHIN
ncbi:hypothetical protein BpHYR1_022076 [Brachionus plicatilis]|uniref:Uncharacterized protein n=1 Tax=Brachionus plicatilis TaxID=10195 RepID=A0A3M7P0S1_BRAPC|nr:hypothetical protein BpHYR1_022076 [Brachionus plicatilis]